MAKKTDNKAKYPYPSHFGSHACMVDEEKTAEISQEPNNPNLVVIKDEYGFYTTTRNRLDDGICDHNRCGERMIVKDKKDEK